MYVYAYIHAYICVCVYTWVWKHVSVYLVCAVTPPCFDASRRACRLQLPQQCDPFHVEADAPASCTYIDGGHLRVAHTFMAVAHTLMAVNSTAYVPEQVVSAVLSTISCGTYISGTYMVGDTPEWFLPLEVCL